MAQAVLSGKGLDIPVDPISIASKIGVHDADMAKLAAALNSGAGVSGNPLHVTISERKSSQYAAFLCACLNMYTLAKGAWIPRFFKKKNAKKRME